MQASKQAQVKSENEVILRPLRCSDQLREPEHFIYAALRQDMW